MAEIRVETRDQVSAQVAVQKRARLYFADHLRAALITLVVLHHVAVIIFLAYNLRGIRPGGAQFGPLVQFGLVSLIAVPTCYMVAWILRKIPGVARVI